jgi:hypothetical protein
MHVGRQSADRAEATGAAATALSVRQPISAGPGEARPRARRLPAAAAWIAGGLALVALFTRISMAGQMNSDGANIALQGWDMLHGHLLLHGWITADASYYTFEVPQLALAELLFGLTSLAAHVVSALTYVIVAALAVALARTGSRGTAAAARCAVVLAVLAVPVVTWPGVATLLEAPQHVGTAAYLLGPLLLIDRAREWRFTAPLAGLILFAGQIGDATVLYVAVPTVMLVCAYHVLAAPRRVPGSRLRGVAEKIRTPDAAVVVAAAASVPLAMLARVAMRYFGGYVLVPPRTAISPTSLWWPHLVITWQNIRVLFGAAVAAPGPTVAAPGTWLDVAAAAFGWACLLAAAFGFARVVWTWRTASRAEQFAAAAIVINLGVYTVSKIPVTAFASSREIAAVLPCGAVLAARAFVPARIAHASRARVLFAAVALAALLPLATGAAQPTETPAAVPVAAWLKAHGYHYGIAGYWDASVVTLESGNDVLVRAIVVRQNRFRPYYWETKPEWYAASGHDATFVIADAPNAYPYAGVTVTAAEQYFGRPVAVHWVADREILLYRTNLLQRLAAPYRPHN